MGRFLGAYDGEEIDRPDLNKCPDCGCFFAGDNCPLCGKVCPEEFRAGNRKPVKQKKRKGNSSSRTVTFMEWYHSWWVIAIALFIAPVIGLILLFTSPHKKSLKVGIGIAAIVWLALPYLGLSLFGMLGNISNIFDKPVDTSLSREEYVVKCESITAEEFYRGGDEYVNKFVCFDVIIDQKIVDPEAQYNNNPYPVYYICHAGDGGDFVIIIRDCIQDSSRNYIAGDMLTVYGEGAEETTLYTYSDDYEEYTAPCINVAYVEVLKHYAEQ